MRYLLEKCFCKSLWMLHDVYAVGGTEQQASLLAVWTGRVKGNRIYGILMHINFIAVCAFKFHWHFSCSRNHDVNHLLFFAQIYLNIVARIRPEMTIKGHIGPFYCNESLIKAE